MTRNPRHSLPPRLRAHQPTRFATAQESTPSPSPGPRMIALDRLLGDVGEHGISPTKGDHRHLGEEYRDLAEDVAGPEERKKAKDRNEPEGQPDGGHAQAAGHIRTRMRGQLFAEKAVHQPSAFFARWPVPP